MSLERDINFIFNNYDIGEIKRLYRSEQATKKLQARLDAGKYTNTKAITNPGKYIAYCIAAQEIGDDALLEKLLHHPECYENDRIMTMLDLDVVPNSNKAKQNKNDNDFIDDNETLNYSTDSESIIDIANTFKYKCTYNKIYDAFELTNNDNGYYVKQSRINPEEFNVYHMFSAFEEKDTNIRDVQLILKLQSGFYEYVCDFKINILLNPEDFDKSKNYLQKENMEQYFDENQNKKYVNFIFWEQKDLNSGIIRVKALCRLPKDFLTSLKKFIDGQNSDGMGEGYGNQEFVNLSNSNRQTISAGKIRKFSGFRSTENQNSRCLI